MERSIERKSMGLEMRVRWSVRGQRRWWLTCIGKGQASPWFLIVKWLKRNQMPVSLARILLWRVLCWNWKFKKSKSSNPVWVPLASPKPDQSHHRARGLQPLTMPINYRNGSEICKIPRMTNQQQMTDIQRNRKPSRTSPNQKNNRFYTPIGKTNRPAANSALEFPKLI